MEPAQQNQIESFQIKNVVTFGSGYVGGLFTSVLASQVPEINFRLVDTNTENLQEWNGKYPPYVNQEPQLQNIINKCKNVNLYFDLNIDKAVQKAQIIFLAATSPTKDMGYGSNLAIDTQYIEQAVRNIKKACAQVQGIKIIVELNTVPVGTANRLQQILSSGQSKCEFIVLANPEFFVEGFVVSNIINPHKVIIGSIPENPKSQWAQQILASLYRHWVSEEKILFTDTKTAELTKFVSNCFLAQRISSINSLSAICERSNANIYKLRDAVRLDPRIGGKYLDPSPGFGGLRLQKDVLNLVYVAEDSGFPEVAAYWKSVIDMNNYQKYRIVRYIWNTMHQNLGNKKIFILGVSFKKNSADCRNSSAINIVVELLKEGSKISIYDPKVTAKHFWETLQEEISKISSENLKKQLLSRIQDQISWEHDPLLGAKGSHGILLLTDHEQFKHFDFETMRKSMEQPNFFYDTRNLLNHENLSKMGYEVHVLGTPPIYSKL